MLGQYPWLYMYYKFIQSEGGGARYSVATIQTIRFNETLTYIQFIRYHKFEILNTTKI